MARENLGMPELVRVLKETIELFDGCTTDQLTAIDLNFRKMRLERQKTQALIWLIRLSGAVLIATMVWATYVRFCPSAGEEKFYSAACKLTKDDLPTAVLAECAARNISLRNSGP